MRGRVLSFFLVSFWLCQVFVAACRLCLVAESRVLCSCGRRASHWGGLSLWSTGSKVHGLLQLLHVGSAAVAQGLQSADSVVVAQAQLPCSRQDLPGPGIKLVVSPALQGGILTTGPSGKPRGCTCLFSPEWWPASPELCLRNPCVVLDAVLFILCPSCPLSPPPSCSVWELALAPAL